VFIVFGKDLTGDSHCFPSQDRTDRNTVCYCTLKTLNYYKWEKKGAIVILSPQSDQAKLPG
jgi:hypothetical protein